MRRRRRDQRSPAAAAVELVVGAEPAAEDQRQAVGAYAARAPANGHGPTGTLAHRQALPVGSHAAPPAIYTGPVIAEYQRAAQPALSQPTVAANSSHSLGGTVSPVTGPQGPAVPAWRAARAFALPGTPAGDHGATRTAQPRAGLSGGVTPGSAGCRPASDGAPSPALRQACRASRGWAVAQGCRVSRRCRGSRDVPAGAGRAPRGAGPAGHAADGAGPPSTEVRRARGARWHRNLSQA